MSGIDDLAQRRRDARAIVKSRGSADGFAKVEWQLLDSPAFAQLSGWGTKALLSLARCYNGRNNGRLAVSARQLSERMGCSHQTAARALRELVALGFARIAQPASFHSKKLAQWYALTCYQRDGEQPTNDYLNVHAANPAAQDAKAPLARLQSHR